MVLFAMPTAVKIIAMDWMSHLFEHESKKRCMFAIEEKRSEFGFCGRREDETQYCTQGKNAPFTLMGLVGSGRQPMKKCPQAQLWTFTSKRYDALEWMFSIMSEARKRTMALGFVAK